VTGETVAHGAGLTLLIKKESQATGNIAQLKSAAIVGYHLWKPRERKMTRLRQQDANPCPLRRNARHPEMFHG